MVSQLNRSDLLIYKEKKKINFDHFIFRYPFDRNIVNFKTIFKESWKTTFSDEYSYFLVNKMQNNILSLLVHEFKFPNTYKNFYRKCNKLDCSTCKFADKNYYINCSADFRFPILDNSNCNSLNLIYIIHCKLCNSFYIGQTVNIMKRIYNHLYDIKKFYPYCYKHNTSISIHFNLDGHNYLRDFRFFIIKKNLEDLNNRLQMEAFLINLFKRLDLKVINDHIPEIKTIYRGTLNSINENAE